MTMRLPSPRLPFTSRVRRWLRRAWLDRLPVAGWLSAWREDRKRRQAAARRPQPPRLLPTFDPYEDRSFLGPNFTMLLQVGLVGAGTAIVGELLRQAFTRVDPLPGPSVAPSAEGPAASATAVAVAVDGGEGGDRGGVRDEEGAGIGIDPSALVPDLPAGMVTRLTAATELTGSLGDLSAPPGPDVSDLAADETPAAHGGGGGVPPGAEASPAAAGAAPGLSPADPPAGSPFTPSPVSGFAGGNNASALPPGTSGPGNTASSSTLNTVASAPATGAVPGTGTGPGGFVGPIGAAPDATNVSKTYGNLPLSFEPNLGQSDSSVQYLSHNAGLGFFLTADGAATLALTRPGQDPAAGTLTQNVLRLSLDGANPSPRLVPEGQLPSYNNYFSGGVSPTSISNVPQYAELVEQDIYPGINLVWHAAPGGHQLEYDFVVAPGADPSAIKLHVEGATGLSTDAQGNLQIQTGGGTLVQTAPVLTQTGMTPVATPLPVAGSAALLPGGDVGFQVGAYDASKPLTIDPVIQYGTYLGGSGSDQAYAVAADGSGDAYVAGTTSSTNFPTSTGAYQTSFGGGNAVFLTKLNAQGTASVYSTYLAGAASGNTQLFGVAVDASGDAYLTGVASNSTFPVTPGAFQTAFTSPSSGFVTKFGPAGDALLYSSFLGNGSTFPAAIAVDPEGNAYVAGRTAASSGGANFPTTSGAFQTTAAAGSHAFLTKFTPDGSALAYSSFLGGSNTDSAFGVAVDGAGDAFVTGSTSSSDFPTTAGAFDTHAVSGAAWVTKVNPAGSALAYSTFLGSSGDQGNAIALDAAGEAFVTGKTSSTSFPTTASAFQTAAGGSGDAFVTRLNAAGSALSYSTYLGGNSADAGTGIGVDPSGDAVVTGTTSSQAFFSGFPGSFPTTSGALQSSYGGSQDAFVTRLNPGGTTLSYSSYLGGSASDTGTGAAVDVFGDGFVVGYTSSTNFPTVSPLQGSSAGSADAYVVKLSPIPAPPAFTSVTGGTSTGAGQVTSSTSLTLSGTAAASATVTVSRSDLGVLGTATANGSGAWSYAYGTTLAAGTYTFTATQTSGSVTSNPTSAYVVTVETAGPAVTLSAPSSTNSLAPVVQVTASDPNGMPDGTTVTIQQQVGGVWSNLTTGTLSGGAAAITLPAFTGAGTYPLRAQVTALSGTTGTSSTGNVTVSSAGSWSMTAQALTVDPFAGDALDQVGNVTQKVPLDLDLSGGLMSAPLQGCSCSANLSALDFNSDAVSQQPVIQAILQSANGAALPGSVSAVLTWNGTAGATLTYNTTGLHAGDALVIDVPVPSAVTTTNAYTWSLTVLVSGQPNLTANGTTYVVAQDASVLGAGWTFAELDQIYAVTGGVLMDYGTGGWRYYASAGGGSFTSPAGDNGTLSQSGGTYTYSTPDGETWTFNSSGYLTGWSSPDGQSLLTYTYSGGNLATMTAIDGTVTTFNYSGGKVSSIVTGNGRTTTLAYSGSNLTQVTNPDGGVETFSYDAGHRLTGLTFANLQESWAYGSDGALGTMTWGSSGSPSVTTYVPVAAQALSTAARAGTATVTDATGDVISWQLDGQGRPLSETAPNGGVTRWAYNGSGYVTSTTDPDGRTTSYALDAAGYPTQVTNPDGTTEAYQYQGSFHALVSMTDQRGQTTTYAYDTEGHQTSTIDALGDHTTSAYNAAGELTAVTDPRGNTTSYAYDTLRRLTATTDAKGGVTTVAFDANGNADATTDPLGRTATTNYDVMGRATTTIDPSGARVTTTFNAAGEELTSTDALGRQTSTVYDSYNRGLVAEAIGAVGTQGQSDTLTSYDADGRVSQTRSSTGWVTTYGYSRTGQQTQSNDALGGAAPSVYDLAGQQTAARTALGQWGNSAYNLVGQVTQSTDALGDVTTSAYDAGGNQTATTDPLGHTATTLYDALGRATTSIDALGNRTTTTYDANGNVLTVKDPLGRVTSYAYDALGRQTQAEDALGDLTTTAYDAAGQVTSTTDALGHTTTTLYDQAGRVTTSIDALGNRNTTTYDASGNVATVKDPAGGVATFLYDAENRRTAVTDPNGHTTTTLYDAAGHVVETIDAVGDVSKSYYNALSQLVVSQDANGAVTRYGYDSAGNRTSLTDPDGNTTILVYDALGRQVNQIDSLGGVTTFAYDAAGNQTVTTDPLGHTATMLYDALGRVTTRIDPLGNRTTNTYDANGNVSTVVDRLGHVTSYADDALNRQTMITEAIGTGAQRTSVIAYDAVGNITSRTDALGHVTTHAYDALNRETAVTDALGHTTTTAYDAVSRKTAITDPMGDTTTTAYDAAGNPITVQDALGHTTTTGYDTLERVTQTTDQLGHISTILYDAVGRVTTTIDALGKRTTMGYDAAENEIQLTDPDGNTTKWVYDALNRRINEIDPFNNRTTTAYDTASRVTSATDQLGRVITYAYDAANRLLGSTWKSAGGSTTNVQTFTYDNAGNQLTAVDYSGNYTNAYDALNRLTAQTDPFGVGLTYAYDAVGRLTTVQDSLGGTTTSAYDAADRLTTREFGGSGQTPLRIDPGYDNASRLTGLTRYSDLAGSTLVGTTSYSYDPASRMTSIVSKNAGLATVSYYNYQYDAADRVTVQSGTGATGTYTYDADGQVLSDGTTTYSYDGNGNRTMSGYAVGTNNQVTTDGTWTYTYDAVGDLTQKSKGAGLETWYYTYDNKNHMTVVRQTTNGTTNALLVTYSYDVYGQRIKEQKWQSSPGTTATTEFVWSGTQVVMDLNGSNTVQERYLWGHSQDQLFARVDSNGTAWWYLTDRLGSVRDVLDATGVAQDHTDYTAYGVITSQSSAASQGRLCWTGKDFDAQTGLQYNLARYYCPTAGTWTSRDPIGFAGKDCNLSCYVGNDPLNYTDWSGLLGDEPGLAPTLIVDSQYHENSATLDWFAYQTSGDVRNDLEIAFNNDETIGDFYQANRRSIPLEGFVTATIGLHTIVSPLGPAWLEDWLGFPRDCALGQPQEYVVRVTYDTWNKAIGAQHAGPDPLATQELDGIKGGTLRVIYTVPSVVTDHKVTMTPGTAKHTDSTGKEHTSKTLTWVWSIAAPPPLNVDQMTNDPFLGMLLAATQNEHLDPYQVVISYVGGGDQHGWSWWNESLVVGWKVTDIRYNFSGKSYGISSQHAYVRLEEVLTRSTWWGKGPIPSKGTDTLLE